MAEVAQGEHFLPPEDERIEPRVEESGPRGSGEGKEPVARDVVAAEFHADEPAELAANVVEAACASQAPACFEAGRIFAGL